MQSAQISHADKHSIIDCLYNQAKFQYKTGTFFTELKRTPRIRRVSDLSEEFNVSEKIAVGKTMYTRVRDFTNCFDTHWKAGRNYKLKGHTTLGRTDFN